MCPRVPAPPLGQRPGLRGYRSRWPETGVSKAHSVEEGGAEAAGRNVYNSPKELHSSDGANGPAPGRGLRPPASAVGTRRVREQLPGTRGRPGRKAMSQSVPARSPPSGAGGVYTRSHLPRAWSQRAPAREFKPLKN